MKITTIKVILFGFDRKKKTFTSTAFEQLKNS